jgi:hypothetical protein
MATLEELIKDTCADLAQDYPAIAARLNAPTEVANPDAGKKTDVTTPRPITLLTVFGVISALPNGATEMAKLAKLPQWAYDESVKAMESRSPSSMANWLQTVSAICGFEPTTAQAMGVALQQLLPAVDTTTTTAPETLPGPSLAEAAGLGVVTPQMVQAALN